MKIYNQWPWVLLLLKNPMKSNEMIFRDNLSFNNLVKIMN
jgi:hypothetical protein